jgi:glyoxylate carboligase
MIAHPFQSIPVDARPKLFWPLLLATLTMMFLMNIEAAPMITRAAPLGIVSYELAGSAQAVSTMFAGWNEIVRSRIGFSLGVDYLFMVVYSSTIGLGCIWAADVLRRWHWPLVGLGAWLGWGLWAAALLDAAENFGLAMMLFYGPMDGWARLAQLCASAKFGLIFLGMVYTFYGLAANLARPRA